MVSTLWLLTACASPPPAGNGGVDDTPTDHGGAEPITPARASADTGWWEPFPDFDCPAPPEGALEIELTGLTRLGLTLGERNYKPDYGSIELDVVGMNYAAGCNPDRVDLFHGTAEPGFAAVDCGFGLHSGFASLVGTNLSREGIWARCRVQYRDDANQYVDFATPLYDETIQICVSQLQPDRISGTMTVYDAEREQWIHISYRAQNGSMEHWAEHGDLPCMRYYYYIHKGMVWSGAW